MIEFGGVLRVGFALDLQAGGGGVKVDGGGDLVCSIVRLSISKHTFREKKNGIKFISILKLP